MNKTYSFKKVGIMNIMAVVVVTFFFFIAPFLKQYFPLVFSISLILIWPIFIIFGFFLRWYIKHREKILLTQTELSFVKGGKTVWRVPINIIKSVGKFNRGEGKFYLFETFVIETTNGKFYNSFYELDNLDGFIADLRALNPAIEYNPNLGAMYMQSSGLKRMGAILLGSLIYLVLAVFWINFLSNR